MPFPLLYRLYHAKEMIATAKTKTSTEVKNRWNAKTYKRYTLSLRHDDDGVIIEYLERHRTPDGKGITDLIKTALMEKMKEER